MATATRTAKKLWFCKQNNKFADAFSLYISTSLYISLPLLHDYDVRMPDFTFYGGRKKATTKFTLPF